MPTIDQAVEWAAQALDVAHEQGIKTPAEVYLTMADLPSGVLAESDTDTVYLSTREWPKLSARAGREAVFHEVGHILSPTGSPHGPEWRRVMRALGYPSAGPRV